MLALGMAAGFAWYERKRPDARIVALVATLAAFAALGRIAFAALPNVKPTTDIVLVSGYALGGAPGFVVGALAGFSSNFFFGQGPWTPWQMGAWGVTGLLGAGLASTPWLAGQPIGMGGAGGGTAYAATTPAGYLLSAQNSDGGFGPAPGSPSSQLYSGWAALGLASEGYNPQSVRHGGASLSDYISGGESSQTDSGSVERTILVLRAAGLPAGGLVSTLQGRIGANGSVSGQVN